ncbi:MAG: RNA methyltransferase [Gammaproteobacteria bacterium]|nr:RNA methyltransferase [Gammaproteobacteria bacterium]MBL6998695.1 RNA methyltransferase [Gammaproteobacteria bacterium]
MKLENIKIVMVETSHPGNIGAAARAMKNMGLSRLALVNPQCTVDQVAYARGAGADEILQQHQTLKTLPEAVADCRLVVGTSARLRALAWPELTPETLAQKALASSVADKVAIVFGRENAGLTNDELQHCQYTVTIPSNPLFSSLNVASAIQVIGYEIYRQYSDQGQQTVQTTEPLAESAELEGYFSHLQQVLISTGFLDNSNPRQMMKRLRRLYQRAEPTRNEVNILRGILSAVEKYRK